MLILTFGSSFTLASFLICFARSAYFSVLIVSSKLMEAGERAAIIIVRLLPPMNKEGKKRMNHKKERSGEGTSFIHCLFSDSDSLSLLVGSKWMEAGERAVMTVATEKENQPSVTLGLL